MAKASDAFEAFVQARQGALVRMGWALTGDRQLGEDLAQAALDRLWGRWTAVSAAGDPWPYAQRIIVSLASTWRRRRWRTAEVPRGDLPDYSSGHDEFDAADVRALIAGWLAGLPARQRAVVVLRYLFDLSIDDTADRLRCSTGTVKSQTAKALNRLRATAEATSSPAPTEGRLQ